MLSSLLSSSSLFASGNRLPQVGSVDISFVPDWTGSYLFSSYSYCHRYKVATWKYSKRRRTVATASPSRNPLAIYRLPVPIPDTMPTESELRSRRDSWPPTQVRLSHAPQDKDEPRPLLDIDEDPLTYFLTPAPDDGTGDDMMDFDAGIEDTSQPREIVRSVSPSSLDGLSKPKGPSSDIDSDAPATDDDDEDYIRLSPSKTGMLSLRDLAIDSLRYRPRSPVFGRDASALLSPASSFPAPQRRGRSRNQARRERTRSLSARSRPGHLWREPSPDVWSIEEETEEEMLSDVGSGPRSDDEMEEVREETEAAKPKKRVRFILPPQE